jgi:hypothetical protein
MSSASFSFSFLDNFPGTVLAIDLDPADHTRFRTTPPQPVAIFTQGFNVTGLVAAKTPGGADVLYATTSGAGRVVGGSPAGATDSQIEAIDPTARAVRGVFPLGAASARGPLAVRPDGLEGVVGRGDFGFGRSQLFRVALDRVDAALAGSTVRDMSADVLNGLGNSIVVPFVDPTNTTTFRFVSGVSYDRAGTRLFAVSFNDSSLTVFAAPLGATPTFREQVRFMHGAASINAQSPHADLLVVREGVPGRSYQGFDVLIGSIGVPDGQGATRGALDGVKTY